MNRISDVELIRGALQNYRQDDGFYPSALTPGNALVSPSGKTYLKNIPNNQVDKVCDQPFSYESIEGGSDYNLSFCLSANLDTLAMGNCKANKSSLCWSCKTNQDCGTCKKCDNSICVDQVAGEDLKNECAEINCSVFVSGWSGAACKKYTTPTGNNGKCDGSGVCASGMAGNCTGAADSAVCGSVGCIKPNPTACNPGANQSDNDTVAKVCYTSGQQACNDAWECNGSGTCACVGPTVPPATLTADTTTIGKIQLEWDAVYGATGYKIYRDTVLKANVGNLRWLDTTVVPGTEYDYEVLATVCGDSSTTLLTVTALDVDFASACTGGSSLGDACNGGWLICKPNDGNCGVGHNYYVSVAPVDNAYSGNHLATWANAGKACDAYVNDTVSNWSLPSGSTGSNTEICQMFKRSNRYAVMAGYNSGCQGDGAVTPRPVTGFDTTGTGLYWSSTSAGGDHRYVLDGDSNGVQDGGYNGYSQWGTKRFRCVKRVAP